MRRVALNAALVLLVLAASLWVAAPYLSAKPEAPPTPVPGAEAPPAKEPARETLPAKPKAMTESELAEWVSAGRGTLLLLWVPRVLAALLGTLFLVQLILRDEKVRHGLLPPPDGLGPTVVATPQQALALGLLWPLGVMLASGALFDTTKSSDAQRLNIGLATAVAAFLPPAFLTCLRRLRLGAGRIPRAAAGVATGLKFACMALMIVLPIQLLWALAFQLRGVPLEIQDVVQVFVRPSDPAQPWVLAVFGAVVAPFTEEGVFRGLLYPSLRARMRGGGFGSAVLVSLLFAGIHGNMLAAVPLFALSLVLCWVMERTNSLLACVTVHVVHNALSLAPMLLRHVQGPTA
jgi:membrane protease YdiL (CAAX protease family)